MTSPRPSRSGEFTGRHMLLLTLSFFGVVVAVNAGMAVLASTSWTGLVVANSYVASQEFEAKRLAHEAQQAAGWQASLAYSPGNATLQIVDGTGSPVDLGIVSLKLNRPVGGHDDQTVVFERLPSGVYVADVSLGSGVWDALVVAPETSRGPFEMHQRFRVGGAP